MGYQADPITIVDFTTAEAGKVALANGKHESLALRDKVILSLKSMAREGQIRGNELHRIPSDELASQGKKIVNFELIEKKNGKEVSNSFNVLYQANDTEVETCIRRMEESLNRKKTLKVREIRFPNGVKKVMSTVALGALLVGGFVGGVYLLGEAVDQEYEVMQSQMEAYRSEQVYIPTAEEIEAANLEYEMNQMAPQGKSR